MFPPPTTSTGPAGTSPGDRYALLWNWTMSGSRRSAIGGHARHLERSGRDDDLVGFVGAVVELDEVAAVAAAHGADGAVELDGQLEVAARSP